MENNINHSNAPFEKVEVSQSVPEMTPPQERKNPLLEAIQMPGRVFQLPSGGHQYTNGELSPNVKNGEIQIKPLSAIAEIKLKNPDMLFSGKAIEEVFAECIPDILKPNEMLGRDVDALMCFLRMVTYGDTYSVDSDHGCENSKVHTYDINLTEIVQDIKALDPTLYDQKYTCTLDNGQVVKINPIRFKDVVEIMHAEDDESTPSPEMIQTNMIEKLSTMIHSVSGEEDKALIGEWLTHISTTYVNKIVETLETSNDWGPSFVRTVKCPDCGEEFELELPVNPLNFFTE